MMENLKERLMRCNDARQLELLLKAVHLMKRYDDKYIQHIYPVQHTGWFYDWSHQKSLKYGTTFHRGYTFPI